MIFRREKGFTLIEVIVSIAITSLIVMVLTMAITILVKNSPATTERSVVLRQVQNAGYSISRDVQMAENIILDGEDGFPLTLYIPVDTDDNNDYSVDYLFDGNKLVRRVYDFSHTLVEQTVVAEYIDSDETSFSLLTYNTYQFNIKASKGAAVTERSYRVIQRVGSI